MRSSRSGSVATSVAIGICAQQTYERDIRALVEPEQIGRYIAIDAKSGDYEVRGGRVGLGDAIRARHLDAQIVVMRIGYRAVCKFGWRGWFVKPA